jgi:hypothetical protein
MEVVVEQHYGSREVTDGGECRGEVAAHHNFRRMVLMSQAAAVFVEEIEHCCHETGRVHYQGCMVYVQMLEMHEPQRDLDSAMCVRMVEEAMVLETLVVLLTMLLILMAAIGDDSQSSRLRTVESRRHEMLAARSCRSWSLGDRQLLVVEHGMSRVLKRFG